MKKFTLTLITLLLFSGISHAEGTVTLTMDIKDNVQGQYVFNTEVIKDLEAFAKKHNLRVDVNIKFPALLVGGKKGKK